MPDPEWDGPGQSLDERHSRVGIVLGDNAEAFMYEYTVGDGWEYRVLLEKGLAADPERST